ncbi:hypothetical protein CI102_8308 [Trichoderma harzianum]|nr:hypothetical protein CI102_8308 [Trichoderma harzianum]
MPSGVWMAALSGRVCYPGGCSCCYQSYSTEYLLRLLGPREWMPACPPQNPVKTRLGVSRIACSHQVLVLVRTERCSRIPGTNSRATFGVAICLPTSAMLAAR